METWDYSVHVTLGVAATLGTLKAGTCLGGALGPLPTCPALAAVICLLSLTAPPARPQSSKPSSLPTGH